MKLLVAVDGSTGAQAAVEFVAANFLPDSVAVVRLVTVHEVATRAAAPTARGEPHLDLRPSLDMAVEALSRAGLAVEPVELAGRPAEVIAAFARSDGVDLVIVGSRGLHGWRRVVGGSVSTRLALTSPVPVLIVVERESIDRIVIGFDGSPASRAALMAAAALPLRHAPTWTVCTAYEARPPLASGIAPTMLAAVENAYTADLAQARRLAEQTARAGRDLLAGAGVAGRAEVFHGPPVHTLIAASTPWTSSLIVVGDRGRSPIERLVLGSTSAGLLGTAPANLLVAHARHP